ncbi:hypothetical protein GCM10015536_70790 [Streptomyces griseomycini]|nr:hypothetical protein GCM10015536_70790 [Streptomyces griseomycini]
MTVIRLGLQRARRRICQDLSRAMLRSTGARAAGRARLIVCWVVVRSRFGSRLIGVVAPGGRPRCRHGRRGRGALAFADPDDAVGAGRSQVIRAAGQRWRDPQQVARGTGRDPHVHAVTAVLLGEVCPAVADTVALGERPVEQDAIPIRLAQDPQQDRRPAGQVLDDGHDVRVGGADGYAETDGDLRERVVPAKVDQAHASTLVGRQLAAAATLTGDDEHGYPRDQSMGQAECGRMGIQQGSCTDGLRLRTPPSTAREPCALRSSS